MRRKFSRSIVLRIAALTSAVCFLVVLFSGCRLFFSYYTLTLSVEGNKGGSIVADPAASDYRENSIVNLTAVADSGWVFESWSGTTSEDGSSATVLMDMNRSVTAVFTPDLIKSNPTDNIINPPSAAFSPWASDDWTFMIYLDADNDLDPYSVADFNEMEEGLSLSGNEANINIIVLYDRWSSGTDWSETRLYEIAADETDAIVSAELDLSAMTGTADSELNMGDPETLGSFITYCLQNYSADNYALVIWNHGSGARSITGTGMDFMTPGAAESRLVCEDHDDGSGDSDYLFTDEIQQALAQAFDGGGGPAGLDLIGFDACLMGTVEAVYELRDYTSFFVASMNSENIYGWDYADLFGRMKIGSGSSGAESLAALIVDSFRNTAPVSGILPSMSAVRTDYMTELKAAIDELAVQLYQADAKETIEDLRDAAVKFFNEGSDAEAVSTPYHDLNDLCYLIIRNSDLLSNAAATAAEAVLSELSRTVVSAYAGQGIGNYYGSGADVKRGLSIFFSKGELTYNNYSHYAYQYWYTNLDPGAGYSYGFIDFCTSDSDEIVESWREMHETWYDPYPSGGYTPGSW